MQEKRVWAKFEKTRALWRMGEKSHTAVHTGQNALWARGEKVKTKLLPSNLKPECRDHSPCLQVAERYWKSLNSMEALKRWSSRWSWGERISQTETSKVIETNGMCSSTAFAHNKHSFHTSLDNGSKWFHFHCGLFHETVVGCCCRTTRPRWE